MDKDCVILYDNILEERKIDIGTILRKKLRKYYRYYIVVGLDKKDNKLACLQYYKELPNDELNILSHCNSVAINYDNFSSRIAIENLNTYETYGMVSTRVISSIRLNLTEYVNNYWSLRDFAIIYRNLGIGEVVFNTDYDDYYMVIEDKPRYTMICIPKKGIFADEKSLLDSIISRNEKCLTLSFKEIDKYDCRYLYTINKDTISKLVLKLKMLGRL